MAGSTRLEGTEFTRENWKPSRKEPAPPACLPQAHYLRCCPPVAPWPVGEGHYLPTNFLMKLTDKTSHRTWNWKTQATSFWSGLTGNGFWKNVNSNKKKMFCELDTRGDTGGRGGENELVLWGGCYPSDTPRCEWVWWVRCLKTWSWLIFTDTLCNKYF